MCYFHLCDQLEKCNSQFNTRKGYGVSKIIRTENAKIPIIALTSKSSSYDILKTKEVGMNAHLSKPIEAKILYDTFSKYIN